MIPALALAVPLLQGARLRTTTRIPREPLGARSLSPPSSHLLKAADQGVPAQGPKAAAHKSGGNRAMEARAGRPVIPLVNQHLATSEASGSEPDPEVRRIQTALRAIEQDPHARQQFYAEVESVIQRVRSGQSISQSLTVDAQRPALLDRASGMPRTVVASDLSKPQVHEELITAHSGQIITASLPAEPTAARPPNFPPNVGPNFGPNFKIDSPRSAGSEARFHFLSPTNSPLDAAVVSRVIHWAQANGCPVELALAVAWQESGMNPRVGRGSSGEIGIMQIMPERARLEGVDPASLGDPETNIRLGTLLLARYYSEEGSVARAAMKYVAGPGVFEKRYASDVRDYISWYSASVDSNAQYFGQYLNF